MRASPHPRRLILIFCSYRFRWVICQLKALQDCFPSSLRRTLDQLPKSLDETYVRVLRQTPQANQAHAHRMLQCLMVAVRPVHVEELAELLAFEFDDAQGGIPKYRRAWQLDDQTQAVLSTCSSLVTIVDNGHRGQIVQFSHFSVKEFLMSNRLGDFSRYHIHPLSAHTILTQACLGVLLHLGDHKNFDGFPLAQYAARYWVEHAKFEGVASRVKDGIETLFDSEKPHLAAWVRIYDIDKPNEYWHRPNTKPNPLYYAVLCGFHDLVKHLAIKHPRHVNAIHGTNQFPLLAALREDHFEIAELLLEHGADVDVRGRNGKTILLTVLSRPPDNLVNIVKFLLKHGADVNARDDDLRVSLHLAEYTGQLEVAEMLIGHNADINSQDIMGKTPLHLLLEDSLSEDLLSEGRPDYLTKDDILNHVWLLLEHDAEVNRRDNCNRTPLLLAMRRAWFELAWVLLEHGADPNAENNNGETPLQILSERQIYDKYDIGDDLSYRRLWAEHGAEVNRRYEGNETPLLLEIGTMMYQFRV